MEKVERIFEEIKKDIEDRQWLSAAQGIRKLRSTSDELRGILEEYKMKGCSDE